MILFLKQIKLLLNAIIVWIIGDVNLLSNSKMILKYYVKIVNYVIEHLN